MLVISHSFTGHLLTTHYLSSSFIGNESRVELESSLGSAPSNVRSVKGSSNKSWCFDVFLKIFCLNPLFTHKISRQKH